MIKNNAIKMTIPSARNRIAPKKEMASKYYFFTHFPLSIIAPFFRKR
jgi:hypothetical protein